MDRAKQFMPFSPLKGFYKLIHEKEVIIEDRIELSEEEYEKLNIKITNLKKGSIVKIKWYKGRGYEEIIGKVSIIDLENEYIKVIKEKINIVDIIKIEY